MLSYKKYIYAVYEERSFSKAARKLYVSQPWLSATVKKVEQELKTPLFNRNTNPITLTEAGRYYIESVEKIIAIEDEMQHHFAELSAGYETRLNIGSSMFFCTYVLPTLLAEFRETYPQIVLTFTEGNTTELTDRLLEGHLDFVLEAEPPDKNLVHSMVWATEQIVLAVPTHYSVNEQLTEYSHTYEEFLKRNEKGVKPKPPVPLSYFSEEPFILLKPGNDSYKRSMAICKNADFVPKTTLYMTQMMTAYYLVCEGQGIAFLRSTIPEYVSPTDKVLFYLLEDPLAMRNIYLSHRKKQTGDVLQKLIHFMKSQSLLPEKGEATRL